MSVDDTWINKRGQRTKRFGDTTRQRYRVRHPITKVSKSFAKLGDAKAYNVEMEAELLKGVVRDPKAGRVLFSTYARQWLACHHYTGGSRRAVRGRLERHLIPFFGTTPMGAILPSTVQAWLTKLRATPTRAGTPLAPRTIEGLYVLLVSIFRAAVVDEVRGDNPCDRVERPDPGERRVRIEELWEEGTVATLLAGTPDRDHIIPLLGADCGLRHGEALAIAVDDVDWMRGDRLTVRHQVHCDTRTLVPPKREKVRSVPLSPTTREALAKHIERYGTVTATCACPPCLRSGKTTHRVLASHRGKLVGSSPWNKRVWWPTLASAGITHSSTTGLHALRHFWVSVMIAEGATAKEISTWAGHSSIQVTYDIYGGLFESSNGNGVNIMKRVAARRGVYPARTQTGA